jgi:hypothetical protein
MRGITATRPNVRARGCCIVTSAIFLATSLSLYVLRLRPSRIASQSSTWEDLSEGSVAVEVIKGENKVLLEQMRALQKENKELKRTQAEAAVSIRMLSADNFPALPQACSSLPPFSSQVPLLQYMEELTPGNWKKHDGTAGIYSRTWTLNRFLNSYGDMFKNLALAEAWGVPITPMLCLGAFLS